MDKTKDKRIIAHFQPQAWINDCARSIDGAFDFDVTERVLEMGKKKAMGIVDGDYSSDDLFHAYADENPSQGHDGPFSVRVEESIGAYFLEE